MAKALYMIHCKVRGWFRHMMTAKKVDSRTEHKALLRAAMARTNKNHGETFKRLAE